MAIVVEIEGTNADRFRAYAATKLTRKPTVADHIRRAEMKLAPFKSASRIRYKCEQVEAEGVVTGDLVKIDAKDTVLSRVVFYRGPVEAETVVGSVDVGVSGKIEIQLVAPPAEPEIDEELLVDE